jgi:hypothetical protein
MNNENQTLQQALDREISIWNFGRDGNSLPANYPSFGGSINYDTLKEAFIVRINSRLAVYKANVQCAEPATVADLEIEVAKIEAMDTDQIISYIDQFVPADNQPVMP